MFTISSPEQFSNAGIAFFEAQFGILADLGSKTLAGAEQLMALNVAAVRACADESLTHVQQLSAQPDARSLLEQTAASAAAGAEKAESYGRHVAGIAAGLKAQYVKVAEEQVKQAQAQVTALVEQLAKNAPAGDHVVDLLKTAIAKSNAGIEELARVSQEGAQAVDAHVAGIKNQFAEAVRKAGGQ